MNMTADKSNGIGSVSFEYERYGTDGSQQPWAVEYSTDGGANWTQIGSNITATGSVQTFNQTVNVAGNIRLRIRLTTTPGTSGDRRMNIDDITITDYTGNKYWDVAAGAGNGVGGTGTWGTTFSTTATGDATLTTASSSDNVFFQGTAGTVTLAASQSVSAMTFEVAGYTVATSGTGSRTLTGGMTLTNSVTFSPIATAELILPSVISGAGGITKSGAGTLTFSGAANTYTGKTTINAGFIAASGESHFGGNPGSFVADQITLNDGGIATTSNINFDSNRGITLGGSGGTFQVNSGHILKLTNVVTGSGSLTKTGDGTLRLDVNSGTHTYTGATIVNAGTLQLERDNDIPDGSNMTLGTASFKTGRSSDNSGREEVLGTLNVSGNATIELGTGNHSLKFANSSSVTWSGSSLTITGWSGTCGGSGTAGKVFFGNSSTALTAAQLAKISFTGFSGAEAILLSTGELVPSNCPSTNSDIIRNTAFTEPSNIDYAAYQATDITTANSIEVARFDIRDGGGSSDADTRATILSSVTFSISNHANLRRVALYDGSSEVAEVAAAASITFSSLSLSAPDNGSKTFTLRATFQSSVTDNQQFQFTVTSASVGSNSSGFAAVNAGGAASSTTADRNRIEVTATKLSFQQQPTNTAVLTNVSPTVTVRALDANNNLDLDFVGTVSLSATLACGSITGNTATAVAGVASFASLQGTVAQTGVTLTASSGSLTTATSSSFDFTATPPTIATLVSWDFADQNNTADGGIAANSGVTISSTGASGGTDYPGGQKPSPDKCILNTDWNSSDGYWATTNISTVGYENITLSSVHRGSNTGPRDWKLQYRIGTGTWTDVSGTDLTLSSTPWPTITPCGTCKLDNVALPAAANNVSNLQVRWFIRSSVAVNGGSIAAGGTNALDEIEIKGNLISAAKDLYYRSTASGDFANPCVWETSLTGSAPWITAAVPPDFTAKTISVRDGHTITLNNAVTLDEFVIETGGTFVLNNYSITWNNGPGVDFTVNGTYQDNASSAQNSVFSSGATWQLGTSATFIKTRNSSSAIFLGNYEGGMSAMPIGSNGPTWILRYTGASAVSFTTVNTFYPYLIFENTSGTPYTFDFTGSTGGFCTVKGDLTVGSSSTNAAITVKNTNTNTNPMLIKGNINVLSTHTLTNDGTGTGFELEKELGVSGNFIVSGTGKYLRLTGSTPCFISNSGTGTITIQDLIVNKSSNDVITDMDFEVLGDLTLTNGNLLINQLGNYSFTYKGSNISRTNGRLGVEFNAGNSPTLIFENAAALSLPASLFVNSKVHNLTLNGLGGVTLGSDTEVTGNLTLTTGTLTVGPNQLTYSGSSITRSGGQIDATNSAATVRFTNASMLTLPASVFSSAQCNNLTINGGGITLGSALTIPNTLTLTSGNILAGSHLLELGTSTSQKGTLSRTSGYVVGSMRRWFSGTNSGDASSLFPIATSSLQNRMVKVEYTSAPTTGGHLTATRTALPMGGSGFPISGIPAVGACPAFNVTTSADEYWDIDNQSGTLTDGSYTLSATAENLTGVTSLCELRLLKRVGSANWTASGTHLEPTGSVSIPTIAASGLSGWSNFGFGGLGGVNPLPLVLHDFWGQATDKGALLSWKVSQAKDISHFLLEKKTSVGGFGATVLIVPEESDFEAEKEFSHTDEAFNEGSYYRLRIVSQDGSEQLSKVVFVQKPQSGLPVFQIYPNPGSGQVLLRSSYAGKLWVGIYDAQGAALGSFEGDSEQIGRWLSEKLTNKGLYLLRFEGNGFSHTEKYIRR